MLYQGNMEEVARQEEQSKKAKVSMRKHDVYRNTKVTSVAQEEQSALAAGVLNQYEDSNDDDPVVMCQWVHVKRLKNERKYLRSGIRHMIQQA